MSSSDYTNLRRLRHVYYPTLNACQNNSHNNIPQVINIPPAHAGHMDPSYPHYYGCPPAPQYYHPHYHPPVVPSDPATATSETMTTCCGNTNHHHHTTTTTVDTHPDTCVSNAVVDTTITAITIKKYYIQPVLNGSIIFTVGKKLQFETGFKVICSSELTPSDYFEAIIHSYDSTSGEITLYKLQSINGNFDISNKYRVFIVPGYQEVDRLKDKLERLYLEVFKINIGEEDAKLYPYGSLSAEAIMIQTSLYYNYFFNENMTLDNDYELTEAYLNKKINFLYEYFFDSSSTVLNINNNDVALDNLTTKLFQLNIYFFGTSGLVNDMTNASV